jgi:hypothetical protein
MEDNIMFDILSNHRIEILKSSAQLSTGNETIPSGGALDMWADSGVASQFTRSQRALIIADVTACAGTLTFIIQDSSDNSTFDEDFATADAIDETGLFLIDIADFYQYLQVKAVAAGGNATYAAYLITFEDRWRPVKNDGTALALTYGVGRKGRVATS